MRTSAEIALDTFKSGYRDKKDRFTKIDLNCEVCRLNPATLEADEWYQNCCCSNDKIKVCQKCYEELQ